ncbi:diguanylate cyclase domain-containing protein [Pseudooceanicola onchidii]|uniref:diguanylate cyclase domain-containing protein n=1 Tax=Pseudooceanicola onchidii TaxID=2562279 RepID=UPI00145A1557|nr:diguanylate cyclase [Pseudooceanicola onchidii]
MHGRILIADDRFASRLMLSALFGGAYYDVQQVDTDQGALAMVRRDKPGIVVISDGLAGLGAAGLCDALRRDPDTADALRIVITDLSDPSRTAMLIHAGADDVIARSCADEEVLARVKTLVDHRAKVAALNLREDTLRPQPGLSEAQAAFAGSASIAILTQDALRTAEWPGAIRAAMTRTARPRVALFHPDAMPTQAPDVVMIDSRTLGTDGTLRLVARMARRSEPRAMQILVAVDGTDTALGVKSLDLGADGVLTLPFNAAETAARIDLLLRRKGEITQLHASLRSGLQSAMTDPLTGLYNRRYALPRLDQYMRDMRHDRHPAALLMADLDHFKWINDTHGHPAGDAVLCAVSKVMKSEAERLGFAARMGGEEFVVALPSCGRLAAAAAARRIREAVADLVIDFPGLPQGLRVTTSVGVAVAEPARMPPGLSPSEDTACLLTQADRALYRAKRAGRNRVVCDMGLVSEVGPTPSPARKVSGVTG